MRLKRKATIPVSLLLGLVLMAGGYAADLPDVYQNSGSNNLSYDLSSKFYAGLTVGDSAFSDNTVTESGKSVDVSSHSMNIGFFGGYKFNDYMGIESVFQRLGKLHDRGGSSACPLYRASIGNLSLDGVVSYPVLSGYQYTASLYAKAGYGLNFTRYTYHANARADRHTGRLNQGAYNLGVGLNVDWRSNISVSIGYTYYQANYPLPGNGHGHAAQVLAVGVYYNFL